MSTDCCAAADHGQPVQLVNCGLAVPRNRYVPPVTGVVYFPTAHILFRSSQIREENELETLTRLQGKTHLYEWRLYQLKLVRWILEYATRGQQWIVNVKAQAATVELKTFCTVTHVSG
jgi:hypothetical protein